MSHLWASGYRPVAPVGIGRSPWSCSCTLLIISPFLSTYYYRLNRLSIDARCPVVGLDLLPSLPEDILTPDLVVERITLHLLCLLGLGIEGSLQLPNCMRCVRSHRAITTSSTALNSVTEAGSLPSGWVVLSQTLERYYAPRGLLPRPPWTSVALIPRRCQRPPASEEISRPGVIRLSQRAIANTPVLEDGSSVR